MMKPKKLYLSYVNLTPGYSNPFQRGTHQLIVSGLRSRFLLWNDFEKKFPGMDLGLIVATREGVLKLSIKGPTKIRGSNSVDFTLYLPTFICNQDAADLSAIREYIGLIIRGIAEFVSLRDRTDSKLQLLEDEVVFGSQFNV